jgi:hypothetical protein
MPSYPSFLTSTTASTLPIQAGVADDHPDTSGGNVVLTVGGAPQPGTIGVADDIDRFRVELIAGTTYRFVITPLDSSLRWPKLNARDSGGSKVGQAVGGGVLDLTIVASRSGTYYVDVLGTQGSTGPYTLQAIAPSTTPVTPRPDDFADSPDTVGVVSLNGGAALGQIERSGDVDYFRVALNAGTPYVFTVEGQRMDTLLRLRAADGRMLASDDDGAGTKDGGSRLAFTPSSTGIYYLDVSSDQGIGSYSISGSGGDDFADTTATHGVLVLDGSAITGTIGHQGDTDVVRVDLRAGVLYRFQVDGVSLNDPDLALLQPDRWRTGSYDEGSGEEMTYMARSDGAYYLFIDAKDYAATGSYSVKALTVPDDLPASNATTGIIQTSGARSTGTLDALEDVDRFRIELTGGTSYKVAAASTDDSRYGFYHLRLLGQDGAEIAVNGTTGTKNGTAVVSTSEMTFTAPGTGTYYVDVWGPSGAYQVSALTPLTLVAAAPADSAAGVARSANLVLTFPRAVQANHGYVNIQTSPNGGTVQRIFIGDTSQVSIAGPVVTIDPAHDLIAGTRYYVSIERGALKDADGNLSAGMENGRSLSFTTMAGNRAPTAADHALVVTQATKATGVLPAAVDADADSVSYLIRDLPQHGSLTLSGDGHYTYEPLFFFNGTDQFRFSVKDSQGGTSDYTATVNVIALPAVQGTAQPDTLAAAAGSHRYFGLDGNDRITTGPGADIVYGGMDTDTLLVPSARNAVTLVRRHDGSWSVGKTAADTDRLANVERVQFTDRSTALDLDGAAGQVARVIGAVFGTAKLHDAALIGRYLALADSGVGGEQVVHQVLADPLFASLAGSRSNEDVVKHVYTNIVGKAPSADEVAYFSGLITGGQYTQESLLWWASSLDLTAQRIDLNGLTNHGLDFLPAVGL